MKGLLRLEREGEEKERREASNARLLNAAFTSADYSNRLPKVENKSLVSLFRREIIEAIHWHPYLNRSES